MQFTDSQIQTIREWAGEGATLSEIQTRIAEEMDTRMSFMEVRLLVIEHDITLRDLRAEEAEKKAAQEAEEKAAAETQQAQKSSSDLDDPEDDLAGFADEETLPQGSGRVTVEISRIAQPGFALTGDVTFSDGVKAQWGLTTRGEISLAATDPDYRPTPEDVQEFQLELQKAIGAGGV